MAASAATAVGLIQQAIALEEDIRKIVQKFANATKTSYEMQLFGDDVNRVKLQFLLAVLMQQEKALLYAQQDVVILEAAAKKLIEQLKEVKEYIETNLPKGFGTRLIWALSAENKASTMIGDFEKRLDNMSDAVKLADQAPLPTTLGEDDFSTINEKYLQTSSSDFKAYYARAHYNPGGQSPEANTPLINVFVESVIAPINMTEAKGVTAAGEREGRAGEIARYLSWSLHKDNNGMRYQTGLLPCLGHYEGRVVFLFPQNAQQRPQTLSKVIHSSYTDQHKTVVPLEARFSLALQLSEAVLKLHTMGLAHCAIRSDTILFLEPKTNEATGLQAETGSTLSTSSGIDAASDEIDRGRRRDENKQDSEGLLQKMRRSLSGRRKKAEGVSNSNENHPGERQVDEDNRGERNLLRRSSNRRNRSQRRDQNAERKGASTREVRSSKPTGKDRLEPDRNPKDKVGDVSPGFGSIYLISWSSLKRRGAVPHGQTRSWKEDIYRHPEQQGRAIRCKYSMGHDIYSLAVCLLEIGMWDSLVRASEKADSLSGQLMKKLQIEDGEDGLVSFLKEEGGPVKIKQSLEQIAEENLPSLMGRAYTKLVKGCLTCLDDECEVDWDVKFEKFERSSDCDAFRKHVVSFLQNITLAFVL